MAAPMESHVKLPYKSVVRKIITRNISILILLGACLSVSLKTGSFLDVVNRTLTSCKLFCALLAVLECLSWAAVVQSSQKRVANVGKCCAVIFLSSVVFHGIAVLYGAPLLESSGETYHLAMLLSVTTVLPASCVLGPHPAQWVRVFLLNMPELGVESTVHMSSVCSLVGAWLGAFPIPLDWDRPWQVWPISCVLGNLSGYCVGLLVSTGHLLYRTRSRKSKLF